MLASDILYRDMLSGLAAFSEVGRSSESWQFPDAYHEAFLTSWTQIWVNAFGDTQDILYGVFGFWPLYFHAETFPDQWQVALFHPGRQKSIVADFAESPGQYME